MPRAPFRESPRPPERPRPAPARRGPHRRPTSPALPVECAQLRELALEQRAKAADILLELPLGLRHARLHHALRVLRFVEQPRRFRLRLAHDHLPLALRGGARVLAQLLRGDEGLVHRFLALAKHPQLLGQRGDTLVEYLALAHRALQRVGDPHAEILDTQRIVPTQRLAELLLADIQRRQVERVVAHGVSPPIPPIPPSLGPNRAVPKRITVAPSRAAVA